MPLIGPSGVGKSTLIRCVNRLVEPTQGSIRLENTEFTKLSGHKLRHARRSMGIIFQEYALVDRLNVMENVLSGQLGYVGFWRSSLLIVLSACAPGKLSLTVCPVNPPVRCLPVFMAKRIGIPPPSRWTMTPLRMHR
jgi:hypothetical protein